MERCKADDNAEREKLKVKFVEGRRRRERMLLTGLAVQGWRTVEGPRQDFVQRDCALVVTSRGGLSGVVHGQSAWNFALLPDSWKDFCSLDMSSRSKNMILETTHHNKF